MTSRRVVLVSGKFWPLADEPAAQLAALAIELRRRGHQPWIVTAQWHHSWPEVLSLEEVSVIRLKHPKGKIWGGWQYARHLTKWLKLHHHEIDVVYVSRLQHDAAATLHALVSHDIPIVLQAAGRGPTGDCYWQQHASFGSLVRGRCQAAHAIVAEDHLAVDELAAAGYDRRRITIIPPGAAPLPDLPRPERREIRRAFGELYEELRLNELTPWAVYAGPLEQDRGLFNLIEAWATTVRRRPDAKLWLVGDGSARAALYEWIDQHQLRGAVILPGVVESPREMLAAADVFVSPLDEDRAPLALLESLAAGRPAIVSDTPAHRRFVTNHQHGLSFPRGDVEALAVCLERLFSQPTLATALGHAGRERVEREFSLERYVDAHIELFEHLLSATT